MIAELDRAESVEKFGGKAANLAKMLQAGLPVPRGFAISIEAFGPEGRLGVDARQKVSLLAEKDIGLPCIVGTKRATKILKTGDKVVLDLIKGEVNK